jgi:hypothetical protein
MSITVIRHTPRNVHVKNPVLFYLQTDNLYQNAGDIAIMDLQINTEPINGDTLEFDSNGISYSFTFATNPDNSGTELPLRPFGTSTDDYIDIIVGYLRKNYQLYNDHDIYRLGTSTLHFAARSFGDEYNFSGFSSTTLILIFISNGAAQVKRDNFVIFIQVYYQHNSLWKLAGEQAIKPDSEGSAVFNVAQFLRSNITPRFTWKSTAVADVLHQMVRKWFARFGEKWGTNPSQTATNIITSEEMIALPGKIKDQIFDENYLNHADDWTTFRLTFNDLFYFLTNQPRSKKTRRWAKERLYLALYFGTYNIFHKLYYQDGSTHTYFNQLPVNFFMACMEVNLGPEIGMQKYFPAKLITKVDVWVALAEGDIISEVMTLVLEDEIFHQERQFFFRNEKGGYDILFARGKAEVKKKYEFQDITEGPSLQNPIHVMATAGGKTWYNRRKSYNYETGDQEELSVNSGDLDRENLEWKIEILDSEEVYEIIADEPTPIRITSQSVQKSEDRKHVQSFDFTYVRRPYISFPKNTVVLHETNNPIDPNWLFLETDLFTPHQDFSLFTPGEIRLVLGQWTTETGAYMVLNLHTLILHNTLYEVTIDCEGEFNRAWAVTIIIDGKAGETVHLTFQRRLIRQRFYGRPDAEPDVVIKIEETTGNPVVNAFIIYEIKIVQCFE